MSARHSNYPHSDTSRRLIGDGANSPVVVVDFKPDPGSSGRAVQEQSLVQRENQLRQLTDEAYNQVKAFLTVADQLEQSEQHSAQLAVENAELRAALDEASGENVRLLAEYRGCLEYIEELHFHLKSKLEEVAALEMESERYRIQLLSMQPIGVQETSSNNSRAQLVLNTANSPQPIEATPTSVQGITARNVVFPSTVSENGGSDVAPVKSAQLGSATQLGGRDSRARASIRRISQFRARANQILPGEDGPHSLGSQINRSSVDGPLNSQSRSEELLAVVRKHLEEKIRWQVYAENLLKLILMKDPEILNINKLPMYALNMEPAKRNEATWQSFALSLVEKMMAYQPNLLMDTRIKILSGQS